MIQSVQRPWSNPCISTRDEGPPNTVSIEGLTIRRCSKRPGGTDGGKHATQYEIHNEPAELTQQMVGVLDLLRNVHMQRTEMIQ